jgi:H/ACA ribonucleoprotein complex non-core subunit NAF1
METQPMQLPRISLETEQSQEGKKEEVTAPLCGESASDECTLETRTSVEDITEPASSPKEELSESKEAAIAEEDPVAVMQVESNPPTHKENQEELNEETLFYSSSESDSSDSESEIPLSPASAPDEYEPIKSKNESEPVVEPIHITIPNNSQLYPVGTMIHLVKEQIIVEQFESGEEKVLDLDSILVDKEKNIIGRINDTFGPVTQPYYSVRFNTAEEASEKFVQDKTCYFIPNFVKIVLTRPLKEVKGTDASNLHDEEVGEDEQEFSDDEKEMEFKKRKKSSSRPRKKQAKEGIPTYTPLQRQRPQQHTTPSAPLVHSLPNQVAAHSMAPSFPTVPIPTFPTQTLSMQYPFNPMDPLVQMHLQQLQMQQIQLQQLHQYNQHQSIQQLSQFLSQLQQNPNPKQDQNPREK